MVIGELGASLTGAPIDATDPEVSAVAVEEILMNISQQDLRSVK